MTKPIVVKVVTIVVFSVFSIGIWVTSGKLDVAWLQWFSATVFVATALITAWDLFLWRLPWAQKIPSVPKNLRGTWKGEVRSLWKSPVTGTNPPPVEAYLVVRQTSTTVNVALLTDESKSTSRLAQVSAPDGTIALDYLYVNRPRASVQHRSVMHHGSSVLDAAGTPAHRLTGRYWTDRDTKGELHFSTRDKRMADDFADAKAIIDGTDSNQAAKP